MNKIKNEIKKGKIAKRFFLLHAKITAVCMGGWISVRFIEV